VSSDRKGERSYNRGKREKEGSEGAGESRISDRFLGGESKDYKGHLKTQFLVLGDTPV